MSIQIISFKCVLKSTLGKVISSTVNRDVINALEARQTTLLKGLIQGLQQLTQGEKRSIPLSAEQAYGFHDPKKVILFPRKKLAPQTSLRHGETISIISKTGRTHTYQVGPLHGDMVTLDGNHPLAGQDLIFDIEATAVREATPQEIANSNNTSSPHLQ